MISLHLYFSAIVILYEGWDILAGQRGSRQWGNFYCSIRTSNLSTLANYIASLPLLAVTCSKNAQGLFLTDFLLFVSICMF